MPYNDLLPIWPIPEKPVVFIDNTGATDCSKELQAFVNGECRLRNADGTFAFEGAYRIDKAVFIPGRLVFNGRKS